MEEDKSWKDYVFEVPIDGKRTYRYEKDHSHDMSYENERKHDNVHSPSHYKHGKKETIEVIQDCMTDDEYHGYLKGNVLISVSNLSTLQRGFKLSICSFAERVLDLPKLLLL